MDMQLRGVALGNLRQIELNLQILCHFHDVQLLEAREHSHTVAPFYAEVQ